MNRKMFEQFQRAADPDLLEEAQATENLARQPELHRIPKRKKSILPYFAAAACLCLLIGTAIQQPWNHDPNSQITDPWSSITLETVHAMGFDLVLPEQAEAVELTALNVQANSAEMIQANYTLDGTAYTCRATNATESEDISGLYETWDQDLSWTVGDAQLQLCSNQSAGYVSWYLPNEAQQWCVSSADDHAELLENAQILAAGLGHELSTAPDGAEDITIRVFQLQELTVAETTFSFQGAHWSYRTAQGDLELVDISGLGEFAITADTQVSYCDGRLSYDEDGAGKLIWFDIVPGVEYSLSVDSAASEQLLHDMADMLFVPMQGDVG